MRVAYLFGGQGCEEPGMGLHLPASVLDPMLETVSELTGEDPRRLLSRGGRGWGSTRLMQPLLVAVGLGTAALLPPPQEWAGHSLGEFTAWVASGGCSLPEGLRLAALRGRVMDGVAGGLCLEPGPGLELAVQNPGERVYGGPLAALRGRKLDVDGPWHTSLMRRAAASFADQIVPTHPGTWVSSGAGLAEGIATAFDWERVLCQLQAREIVLCGPARPLRRHLAQALPDARVWRTDNPTDLAKTRSFLETYAT